MDRREVARGIRASWTSVSDLGLGLSFSAAHPLDVDEAVRDVALNKAATYQQIFRIASWRKHYNFILNDFSFFQFSIAGNNLRYAFYPNPFVGGLAESIDDLHNYVLQGVMTEDEFSQAVDDANIAISNPPIRYDHAPDQYRGLRHPTSHFHIGHATESRWPIARVISPQAFTLLILKQYYSTSWALKDNEDEPHLNSLDRDLSALRAACVELDQQQFSPVERLSFHFF